MILFCIDTDLTVDWNAVAAIGQVAGALFTAIAVVVALYFSNLANKTRVSVKISAGAPVMPGGSLGVFSMICTAVNVGASPVKLESCVIVIQHAKRTLLLSNYSTGLLPAYLQSNENVVFSVPASELAKSLRGQGLEGKRNIKVSFFDSGDFGLH